MAGHGETQWENITLAFVLSMMFLHPILAQGAGEDTSGTGDCTTDETIRFRGGTARLENDLFAWSATLGLVRVMLAAIHCLSPLQCK